MAEDPGAADRVILLPAQNHDLRGVTRRTSLGPYRLRAGDMARLRSIYLDTPGLTLTRDGITLRLQRHAGQWKATLRRMPRPDGISGESEALTVALPQTPQMPFPLPAGALRTQLSALVAGRPLNPILIVDVRRRRFDVWGPTTAANEEPAAALLLNRVRVYAPEDPPPPAAPRVVYDELVVQRRRGERRDVTRLVRLLREAFSLLPSRTSAVARGLALVGRQVPPAPAEPRVLVHDTVQSAAHKIVGRHLGRLREHDPGARLGEDPEALHNMRVAVRRLRAAVRVFAPAFPSATREHLSAELQWLGQITGGVRDLDVQLARLHQFGTAFPAGHRAGLATLRTYMETERTRRRTELLAGLDSRRYFHLLVRLEVFVLARSHPHVRDTAAREPVTHAGAQAIKRAWRRLLKRGNRIKGAPAPEDLHALRIRAKRLRYLLEFLQELNGKRGRRLVKRLVILQDLLGAYHDAVVTAEFVRQYAEGPGAQMGAAGLLTLRALRNGALRAADERCRDFRRTWRRFSRKRTRNEFRALVQQLRAIGPRSAPTAAEATARPLTVVAASTSRLRSAAR